MYNKDLHGLYRASSIVRIGKWGRHVAGMGEKYITHFGKKTS
jgi:hypothetical protein